MSKLLSSWKEIGCYLGKGVRTVQRWEHTDGLPVHRPRRFAVVADTAELDDWIRSEKSAAAESLPQSSVPDLPSITMLIVNQHPRADELKTVLERAGCKVTIVRQTEHPEEAFRGEVMLALSFADPKRSAASGITQTHAPRAESSSHPPDRFSQFS